MHAKPYIQRIPNMKALITLTTMITMKTRFPILALLVLAASCLLNTPCRAFFRKEPIPDTP
jgi:hypothetical protein